MARYTLSIVCNELEKRQRLTLVETLRASLRSINYRTEPGRAKAAEINSKLSELAEPLWKVSIDYFEDTQVRNWQCWASMDAIRDWQRMPSMSVNVLEQWSGPRLNRSKGQSRHVKSNGKRAETVPLDREADKYLEAEASRLYKCNGIGLGRFQNAFRLARLDSELRPPTGHTRKDQRIRSQFYLAKHPYAAESIAYKCLYEGTCEHLRDADTWILDLIGKYLDLWDTWTPGKTRQRARFQHDKRDRRQISRVG